MEHPSYFRHEDDLGQHLEKLKLARGRMGSIAGVPCLSQSFIRFDSSSIGELPVMALVIGGNATDWDEYRDESLADIREVIRKVDLPILGICGGHQLICMALGGKVAPMGRLNDGETDPKPDYRPGFFKERGFKEIEITADSRLWNDLPDRIIVSQSHYCEVKRVPEKFSIIARSSNCPVQAVSHSKRPIFGVQFHPERFDPTHIHGRTVLENFFHISEEFTSR